MLNKKWAIIQPLETIWEPPPINTPWNNHPDMNMSRLLQCKAYHINHVEQGLVPLDADVYFIGDCHIGYIDKEIAFAKKLKELGKKVVISYSADLRFLIGNCLITAEGTLYTELAEYADVILSGFSADLRAFGRYQDKVFPWGVTFERYNFSEKPFEHRTIDLVLSGSIGEECLGMNLELMLLIRQRHPEKRIVYFTHEPYRKQLERWSDKIEVWYERALWDGLKDAKHYISPEYRPRAGRAIVDAWMYRVPFITSKFAYHSNLFPEFAFAQMDLDYIADLYDKMLATDYNTLIAQAEARAEYDYFDNAYPRLMKRLFPDEQ
jgi:hypothetical protein